MARCFSNMCLCDFGTLSIKVKVYFRTTCKYLTVPRQVFTRQVPHLVYYTLLNTHSGCADYKQRPNYLTIPVHKYFNTWWYISCIYKHFLCFWPFPFSEIYIPCPCSLLISILCSSLHFLDSLLLFLPFPPFFVSALYPCFLFPASFVTLLSHSFSLPLLVSLHSGFLQFYFRFIVSSFRLV